MNDETGEDTIFEGSAGIYRRIDLEKGWGDTSSLTPFDSELKSLGFRLVGDLICSALDGILRCYVNPVEKTRAVLLAGIKGGQLTIFGLLFELLFADGESLTTTTSAAMKDMPEKGIHRRFHAWTGVYDLYHKHQQHVDELKAAHGEGQPMSETLLSLAESIDASTIRTSG